MAVARNRAEKFLGNRFIQTYIDIVYRLAINERPSKHQPRKIFRKIQELNITDWYLAFHHLAQIFMKEGQDHILTSYRLSVISVQHEFNLRNK